MQLTLFDESIPPDWEALDRCLRASVVAVDIETQTRWPGRGPRLDYGLSYPAAVTVIALAWVDAEAARGGSGGPIQATALAAPFPAAVPQFIAALFAGPAWIVAHNAVFDLRQLSKLTGGLIPARIWDTQAMARLLHPAVDVSYSLLGVATALGIPYAAQQAAMKAQRGKLYTLPLEQTLAYARDDAALTLNIYQAQQALARATDPALIDWECRANAVYCGMAARGIRLNIPFTERRIAELGTRREALAARLAVDGLANPGSNRERAQYLYVQKGIPLPEYSANSWYFTRAGHRRLRGQPQAPVQLADLSTRSSIVESYREEGSPYSDRLRDLADYMAIDWLISALTGLIDHAAFDGRLHSLLTTATESGRRASSYPHMQNWKMPEMAGVAIGDEGFTLVEIDYRNAESVMAAFIAGDSALAAACRAVDFHATMAAQYFGEAWSSAEPTERKRLRTMAKKITFGTAYGMGAERLGESINVSTAEARRIMAAKDRTFAAVARARDSAKARVRAGQLLELWTGRQVAVPSAFVAWNYLCQGGVSEVLKRAIVTITEAYQERGMRSRVALDMHDAIILEVAHAEWTEALDLASAIMCSVTPEALNQRTDPPIQWVARPDLAENRLKWGAEQPHPALSL